MKNWKKGVLLFLTAIMITILYAFGGGNTAPYKIDGTIVGVMPQHATRIEIIYKDQKGNIMQRSTHQSEIITDGKTTVDPHDYLSLYCKKECKEYYLNR